MLGWEGEIKATIRLQGTYWNRFIHLCWALTLQQTIHHPSKSPNTYFRKKAKERIMTVSEWTFAGNRGNGFSRILFFCRIYADESFGGLTLSLNSRVGCKQARQLDDCNSADNRLCPCWDQQQQRQQSLVVKLFSTVWPASSVVRTYSMRVKVRSSRLSFVMFLSFFHFDLLS